MAAVRLVDKVLAELPSCGDMSSNSVLGVVRAPIVGRAVAGGEIVIGSRLIGSFPLFGVSVCLCTVGVPTFVSLRFPALCALLAGRFTYGSFAVVAILVGIDHGPAPGSDGATSPFFILHSAAIWELQPAGQAMSVPLARIKGSALS
jgi:hypothetical protein